MATKKKLLQAAAGSAGGGAGLNVEEVFSTYLYVGNNDNAGNTQTITNGIDLDGEGGLVWIKNRTGASNHILMDTERGVNNALETNDTAGTRVYSGDNAVVTSFNSNGFGLGEGGQGNYLNSDYASWTFRKAPKFFDVVTYTGDGTSSQQIAHNLGVTPGLIIVKAVSSVGSNPNWLVWHRSLPTSAGYLNDTIAFGGGEYTYNFNAPSDTYIDVKKNVLASGTNDSGITYVAYLFAHNDGDGEFGPDGDADIIKCGSYTGTGAAGKFVDLGFEPQWVLTKRTDLDGYNWVLQDNMRSMTDTDYAWLYADLANAEGAGAITGGFAHAQPTGYIINGLNDNVNGSGGTYVYIAIRRGPMAVPESATDVFAVTETSAANNAEITIGFPTDLHIANFTGGDGSNSSVYDRLRGFKTSAANGTGLITSSLAAENTSYNIMYAPNMTGYKQGNWYANSNSVRWDWKRAPSFCDIVAYTGDGVAGRTVSHNLDVAPEMMWIKWRDGTQHWYVYSAPVGNEKTLFLSSNAAVSSASIGYWNNTSPTSTDFTLGLGPNQSGRNYIAYLFASLDGVSKVGSYTGTGAAQNIECGFSNGARFVLIKKTTGSSDMNWWLFDTERGLVSGDDSRLFLNTTDSEYFADYVDPYSGGFAVESFLSESGVTYIFYAIA